MHAKISESSMRLEEIINSRYLKDQLKWIEFWPLLRYIELGTESVVSLDSLSEEGMNMASVFNFRRVVDLMCIWRPSQVS